MTRDDCILLGSITKTHGVRGELILRTGRITYEPDKKWGSLFLEIDGIMVPFFISDVYMLRDREWVLGLDDIPDKTAAEKLCGKDVWVLKQHVETEREEIDLTDLAGFSFQDKHSGKKGIIKEFLDIPGNPVLEVLIEGKSHLVPVQDEFILEFNTRNRSVKMDLPDGLI